jgi:hypothetical protein
MTVKCFMLAKVCEVMQRQMQEQKKQTMRSWRRLGLGVAALGITALLSGCGIFGCSGSATNGAAFGGCGAGMRF